MKSFSATRIRLIAGNTLREAVRQRLVHGIVLLALALVIGARWLRDFNFGVPELRFLADCGFGAIAFFGAVLTITAMAQLFFSELENRTAETLLAKPVWRAEFVLGKFVGVAALTAGFCALLTLLLVVVLWSRERELLVRFPDTFAQGSAISYAAVVAAGFLQWLKLLVLAAFVLWVASFAPTALFTIMVGFVLLVAGHLQSLAREVYARAGGLGSRIIGALLGVLLPNFQLFELPDRLGLTELPAAGQLGRLTAYACGYVVVAAALAIASFRRREL